jgi:hypothetical protein
MRSFFDLLAIPVPHSPFSPKHQLALARGKSPATPPAANLPPISPGLPSGANPPQAPPSQWAEQALHFHPDPVQREILDCPDPDGLLLCTRQFGKTTITAIKAAHHALSRPDAKIVVGSRSQRQSEILVRKTAGFLRHAGAVLKPAGLKTFGYSLPNGAQLYALPHSPVTTRGFGAVTLLIFDEAAVVSDELYDMATAFQAAAPNPSLWLLSSAGPQSGFFYDEWSDPRRTHWRRFKVTAPECPRISPGFLARERLRKGEAVFRREYLCEFLAYGDQVISRELLQTAESHELKPWNGGKPLWRA